MKSSLAFLLLFATQAWASPMKVKAMDYTCEDIQQLLRTERTLIVAANIFGRYKVFATPSDCPSALNATSVWFRTIDEKRCDVGYTCESPHFPY